MKEQYPSIEISRSKLSKILIGGAYMNKLAERKNIRLKEYDYSQAGYYFITICSLDKKKIFWNKEDDPKDVGETFGLPLKNLSNTGKIIDEEINKINSIYENVEIDKYVIMPNHIHMIIILHNEGGRSKTSPTISRIIQQFKASISKKIGYSIWQKSFYDHIIRDERDYENICNYIETNPIKWKEDKYYNF